nr:MAG TPA: hypothetical protein [Caudoviricetes sp.]
MCLLDVVICIVIHCILCCSCLDRVCYISKAIID